MKRFLTLVAASAVLFSVGCASSGQNASAGAVGKTDTCATKCDASAAKCTACKDGKMCDDCKKKAGAMGAVGTEKKSCGSCSGGTCPVSGNKN